MGALLAASGLPMLFDQSQQGGYNVWGATQTLRLTFPTGFDVVAAGDRIVDMDDGTSHYSEWVVPGFHSVAQPPLMFGDYAEHPVAGSAPPTTVFRASNAPTWGEDMASWMPSILAFLAEQTGATLPYDTLSIVKLPGGWIFPGTVGYGTVYLSDDYGGPSAHYFEETLAHETSHSWWGVMVGPTDYPTTRWLVEGL
ncbi:MAG: hypothetical protein KC731_30500, partial [Myxococcales bacterium]|nr:hypothetical protein [Myxococcales bacterium]